MSASGYTEMANRLPLVSVLIPNYNLAPYLGEAIDSAFVQDYPHLEVIVNDDGSTDESPAVLESYGKRIKVTHTKREGIGAARNAAMAVAGGELIALLDADDVWLPHKLLSQVRVMMRRPEVAVCHTATELCGTEMGDGPIVEEVRRRIDGRCFEALFQRNGIVASSAICRRSMMPPRGFDTRKLAIEDYQLWLAMLANHEAAYIPQVMVKYRRRPGQASGNLGRHLQVSVGIIRLEILQNQGDQLEPDMRRRLYDFTLAELHACAYSRYYKGDFRSAQQGFDALRRNGREIPFRHRLKCRLMAMLAIARNS